MLLSEWNMEEAIAVGREEGREEGTLQTLCNLVYKGLLSFSSGVMESKLPQETFLQQLQKLHPDYNP